MYFIDHLKTALTPGPDADRRHPSPPHAVDPQPPDRHRRRHGSSPTARATRSSSSSPNGRRRRSQAMTRAFAADCPARLIGHAGWNSRAGLAAIGALAACASPCGSALANPMRDAAVAAASAGATPPPAPIRHQRRCRGRRSRRRRQGRDDQRGNAFRQRRRCSRHGRSSFRSPIDLDHRRALLCLTQAVYYEAGFEPIEGRRAVAQVVLNRMRHPAFPKSVCGVVYQRNSAPVCQFSFVCDGSLDRRAGRPRRGSRSEIAAAALAGYVEREGRCRRPIITPIMSRRAGRRCLPRSRKIGAHIFYRWPGTWGQPAAFTGRYIGEPRDPATMRPLIFAVPTSAGRGRGSDRAGTRDGRDRC